MRNTFDSNTMKNFMFCIPGIVILFSCDNRLNDITVKNKDIIVTKYEESYITSVKSFIEVKKGFSTVEIMESNSEGFAGIIIRNDTIIIQSLPTVIYKFTNKAFNYKVKLDTTITVDYWRQKAEEMDKRNK